MTSDSRARDSRSIVWLFAATIFVSSTLLFWLELLFGKMVLPLLGGAPAVWNVCLLFYQTALLVGYLWAHLLGRLSSSRYALLQVALLLAALGTLPIAIPLSLLPPSDVAPNRWLLGVLTVGIGLPFVAIASNGPLIQRWLSRMGPAGARDPYVLYAASNIGSAAALLLYPTLIEPGLTLRQQSRFWGVTFVITVILVAACAARFVAGAKGPVEAEPVTVPAEPLPWSRRMLWLFLAAVPSSLMLGVTNYVSLEIAPIPLVWIVPLAIYLATLVVAFAAPVRTQSVIDSILGRHTLSLSPGNIAVAVAILLAAIVLVVVAGREAAVIAAHLLLFAGMALVCHSRLAASRPGATRLTEFYLWIAAGGALGATFNTFVGPMIFTSVMEYPLALVAALMLFPKRTRDDSPVAGFTWADLAQPAAVLVIALIIPKALAAADITLPFPERLLLAIPALACLTFSGRPVRFGAGLAAVIIASTTYPSEIGNVIYESRDFFGVHRVLSDDRRGFRWITHGSTVHGGQWLDKNGNPIPLAYYHPTGPVGDLFYNYAPSHPAARICIIGLGTGAMASYAAPNQHWTFFEIDPEVVQIAQHPSYFSFLEGMQAPHLVVVEDARLALEGNSTAVYDMIVLDAFGSDQIPAHLLTREAVQLYLSRLSPDGLLVMHISNRFLGLGPVVAALARDAGLAVVHREDGLPDDMESTGKFGSHWAVLARKAELLAPLRLRADWEPLPSDHQLQVWTDDYSSILPLLRSRRQ